MDVQFIGIIAALSSALAWAVGAILYKKLGEGISSLGMNLVKGLLSLLLLTAVVFIAGVGHMGTDVFLLLGLSGLLGISLGDTFFFEALQKTGAHLMVLLSLLGQVLTVFLAVIFLNESLTISMWAGIVLVVSGIAGALYSKISREEKGGALKGITYGLLSVLCMSVSIIVTKKGLSSVSAVQATFVRMLWGTIGLLFWGIVTKQLKGWLAPFKEIALIKKISVAVCVATFGGFWLFHVALKYTAVAIANTLNSTEPLFVIPLAAVFLKERITLGAIVGAVVSVSGIIVLLSG